jgi:hypothetical protein
VDPRPLEGPQLEQVIAMLEANVARDTLANETGLRPQIRAWFMDAETPLGFADLNARLYAQLFLTPADDAWLGIDRRGTFTGLPGDGLSREPR